MLWVDSGPTQDVIYLYVMNTSQPDTTETKNKIRVGIFFGGKSAEHDVSVNSAKNVLAALDETKFTPVTIEIGKDGVWKSKESITSLINSKKPAFDVAFPILHGPYGEDGSMQGLFEVAGIPYVGPGVLSSAVNMDKDISKRLLKAAGIAVAPSITTRSHQQPVTFQDASEKLGTPLFIKPANMGSSIGVSKVSTEAAFNNALKDAFQYDHKVLIEGAIIGDEIECSVLGNEHPRASAIGRIRPNTAEFYDYNAKYFDENGAILEIPANISPALAEKAQDIAIQVYKTLECQGMSRVDMFLTKEGDIIVGEINTIPGFTNISMYPKLWEVSGLSYTNLITEIIELALERHDKKMSLKTTD